MTSTEQQEGTVTLAARRPGVRHPVTETRVVEVDITAPDIASGMRTFSPAHGEVRYARNYLGGGVWSPWRCLVTVQGPRRLAAGHLSTRTMCDHTYREDATERTSLAMPAWLQTVVDQWRPAGDR